MVLTHKPKRNMKITHFIQRKKEKNRDPTNENDKQIEHLKESKQASQYRKEARYD